MIWLILGLALWVAGHSFKRLAPGPRAAMGDRAKGLVALLAVAGIVLMVIGYRASGDSAILWNRQGWFVHLNNLAMLVAIYLFAASGMKTRAAVALRHPQLIAVLLWSGAHLLVAGDLAGLVLFGGLGLWALGAILLINAAEPRPAAPAPAPAGREIGALVGAVAATGLIGWAHTWFGLWPFGG